MSSFKIFLSCLLLSFVAACGGDKKTLVEPDPVPEPDPVYVMVVSSDELIPEFTEVTMVMSRREVVEDSILFSHPLIEFDGSGKMKSVTYVLDPGDSIFVSQVMTSTPVFIPGVSGSYSYKSSWGVVSGGEGVVYRAGSSFSFLMQKRDPADFFNIIGREVFRRSGTGRIYTAEVAIPADPSIRQVYARQTLAFSCNGNGSAVVDDNGDDILAIDSGIGPYPNPVFAHKLTLTCSRYNTRAEAEAAAAAI